MPYQVQQIIEGKGTPTCVKKDDSVSTALALMVEHDFSQLPVIKKFEEFDVPEGMVTYEGILRGIRNFKAKIDDLKVRDVMINAPTYSLEDDLFDILDRLKETNAVLITENIGLAPDLVGIVTSYDTTEYFRERTEDLMRVEDIELMVKDFIKAAHLDENGEVDEIKLGVAVSQITAYKKNASQGNKNLDFDELSLGDYISLLLYKDVWKYIEPII
jgi:CBS domain-containing protein